MDIAKYITTAVVLTSIFGDLQEEWIIYMGGSLAVVVTLLAGLWQFPFFEGDAPFFGIYAEKDFIANTVGYLQINGFTFLEIHRLPTIDDFRLFKPKVSQRPVEHRKHGSDSHDQVSHGIVIIQYRIMKPAPLFTNKMS